MRKIVILLFAVLGIGALLWIFSKGQTGQQAKLEEKSEKAAVLVEYSDYQCPACRSYDPLVRQLRQDLGEKMIFVYRHFPLPQHKNAELAAKSAEAAARQGKYWEMHAQIFEKQNEWSESDDAEKIFTDYAATLSLDIRKFSSDLNDSAIQKKVFDDKTRGLGFGVNATPTFFVQGYKINNPRSFADFKRIIEDADPLKAK